MGFILDENDIIKQVYKLLQAEYKQTYPDSKFDFETLDLTEKVSQRRVPLGQGRYSDVFMGELDDDTKVAIKMLRLPPFDSRQVDSYRNLISRFFRELDCWYELKHLNIAALLGFKLSIGSIGFVSFLYPGNVVQYLKSGAIVNKHSLILDVAEGLQYLHAHDPLYVHGSVKGDNVLVNGDGIACISDFGTSKIVRDLSRITGFVTSDGLKSGLPWMAPELLSGEAPSSASDIYAFAGVLLEILCPGKTPYHYLATESMIITAKTSGALPDCSFYDGLQEDDDLWRLMVRCWNSDRSARPGIQETVKTLYAWFGLRPRVLEFIASRPPAALSAPQHNLKLAEPTHQPSPSGGFSNICERDIRRHDSILLLITIEETYLKDLEFFISTMEQNLVPHRPRLVTSDHTMRLIAGFHTIVSPFRKPGRTFLGVMYDRHAEQRRVIHRIGDILLKNAEEFGKVLKQYMPHLKVAKRKCNVQMIEDKVFCPASENLTANISGKRDILSMLNLPPIHLHACQQLLTAIIADTEPNSAEYMDLVKASSINSNNLVLIRIEEWQSAMLPEPDEYFDWQAAINDDTPHERPLNEQTRTQKLVYELVRREMSYVKDLESFYTVYLKPLEDTMTPVNLLRQGALSLEDKQFVPFDDLLQHHSSMLTRLHNIQLNEYPNISLHSILVVLLHFAVDWTEVYNKYIRSYGLTAFRIEHEWVEATNTRPPQQLPNRALTSRAKNQAPDLVDLAIPMLFWYRDSFLPELETLATSDPQVHDSIKRARECLCGTLSELGPQLEKSKRRAEMLRFVACLDELPLNLAPFDEDRQLLHSGPLYYGSPNLFAERHVVLFDNCLLITVTELKNGITRYRCIKAVSLQNSEVTRYTGSRKRKWLLSGDGTYFPFTLVEKSKFGQKPSLLFAATEQDRLTWRRKLKDAGVSEHHSSSFISFFKLLRFW